MSAQEDDVYVTMVATVRMLIELDPPADTPLGVLLRDLAGVIETYEQMRWPLGKPPEPEK